MKKIKDKGQSGYQLMIIVVCVLAIICMGVWLMSGR